MSPSEISVASVCLNCIPDKLSAMLFLLAQIAGVTDPETISVNARCYECISDKQSAILYLLDQIVTASGKVGCALETNGDPEGVLTSECSPAFAVDPNTQALYIFTGVAGTNTGWLLKA